MAIKHSEKWKVLTITDRKKHTSTAMTTRKQNNQEQLEIYICRSKVRLLIKQEENLILCHSLWKTGLKKKKKLAQKIHVFLFWCYYRPTQIQLSIPDEIRHVQTSTSLLCKHRAAIISLANSRIPKFMHNRCP